MDSMSNIYLERAENELIISETLLNISNNKSMKEKHDISSKITFYSAVIAHSYYSIFYSAKAILLTKNIKTKSPEVHKKTYDKFKELFIDSGLVDLELLKTYSSLIIRADTLLEIFKDEKWKRGHFTYKTIPQANKEPAQESLKRAKLFVKHIKIFIQ